MYIITLTATVLSTHLMASLPICIPPRADIANSKEVALYLDIVYNQDANASTKRHKSKSKASANEDTQKL